MALASRDSEKGHWTRSTSPFTPLLLGLDLLKCPEAPGEDQQAETTGVQNHVSTACSERPPLEMPPVPRRQARTSSPPDLPRTAGSALRTQQVSARTQGAALHPPASLPEDKATSAAWLGSLSPPRKHRRRRMSRRRGPGRCSACCRLGSVLQQCQCSLPGHLRGRGGGVPSPPQRHIRFPQPSRAPAPRAQTPSIFSCRR